MVEDLIVLVVLSLIYESVLRIFQTLHKHFNQLFQVFAVKRVSLNPKTRKESVNIMLPLASMQVLRHRGVCHLSSICHVSISGTMVLKRLPLETV